MNSKKYILRAIALLVVVATSIALVFSNKLGAFQHDHSAHGGNSAPATNAGGDRKILYWYDAMNPQHTLT
jgi:hypothetical protein